MAAFSAGLNAASSYPSTHAISSSVSPSSRATGERNACQNRHSFSRAMRSRMSSLMRIETAPSAMMGR